MPKGQLSRVPWPGNSWMPFTFQPTLWVLQQPHKHSYSLQLANKQTKNRVRKHFECSDVLVECDQCFFKSKRISSKYHAPTSNDTLKGRQPHQSDTISLFILVAAMGKCKQIINSNLRYVSDVIIESVDSICRHSADTQYMLIQTNFSKSPKQLQGFAYFLPFQTEKRKA